MSVFDEAVPVGKDEAGGEGAEVLEEASADCLARRACCRSVSMQPQAVWKAKATRFMTAKTGARYRNILARG